jgi:Rrf2 family protein
MLQLTKRTEYGLIALSHLAGREGSVVSAREISERYPVPPRLLAEVLKDLARTNLVHSTRGAHGGYTLARSPGGITVGEVVAALEGHPTLTSCESLGAYVAGDCEVEPVCPIRSPIHRLRGDIWELLERTTLLDLVRPSQTTALREAR